MSARIITPLLTPNLGTTPLKPVPDSVIKRQPIGYATRDTLAPAQTDKTDDISSVEEDEEDENTVNPAKPPKSEKTVVGSFFPWLKKLFGQEETSEKTETANCVEPSIAKPLPQRPVLPSPSDEMSAKTLQHYLKAAQETNQQAAEVQSEEDDNEKKVSYAGKVDAQLLLLLLESFKKMEGIRSDGVSLAIENLKRQTPELKRLHEEWEKQHRALEKLEKQRKAFGISGQVLVAINVVGALAAGVSMVFTGGATMPLLYQFAIGTGAAAQAVNTGLNMKTNKQSGKILGDQAVLNVEKKLQQNTLQKAQRGISSEMTKLHALQELLARVAKTLREYRIV